MATMATGMRRAIRITEVTPVRGWVSVFMATTITAAIIIAGTTDHGTATTDARVIVTMAIGAAADRMTVEVRMDRRNRAPCVRYRDPIPVEQASKSIANECHRGASARFCCGITPAVHPHEVLAQRGQDADCSAQWERRTDWLRRKPML